MDHQFEKRFMRERREVIFQREYPMFRDPAKHGGGKNVKTTLLEKKKRDPAELERPLEQLRWDTKKGKSS